MTMIFFDNCTYLWLQVSMDNPLEVHKIHSRNEFLHQAGCFDFIELFLFPDPLQELAAPQVFHDNVGVGIILRLEKNMYILVADKMTK